jgi:hypothetical protein
MMGNCSSHTVRYMCSIYYCCLFIAYFDLVRNGQVIMIAALLLLCKNFNVDNYSNMFKVIKLKLGIHSFLDKLQLLDMQNNSESYMFEVMLSFNL